MSRIPSPYSLSSGYSAAHPTHEVAFLDRPSSFNCIEFISLLKYELTNIRSNFSENEYRVPSRQRKAPCDAKREACESPKGCIAITQIGTTRIVVGELGWIIAFRLQRLVITFDIWQRGGDEVEWPVLSGEAVRLGYEADGVDVPVPALGVRQGVQADMQHQATHAHAHGFEALHLRVLQPVLHLKIKHGEAHDTVLRP